MTERITLTAPDISCGHCVAAIQKTVGALAGVEAVAASESTKQVDVTFDPGKVSVGQISEAMAEEGYPVKS